MPTHDVLLRMSFLQNVIHGRYTWLHTLVSYVLLIWHIEQQYPWGRAFMLTRCVKLYMHVSSGM